MSLTMATCLISAFLPGTSAAQADDLVSESVCQPNPTTMQLHIEKGVVTSGRGKGKTSGKRMTPNQSHAELAQVQDTGVQPISFCS